ncbi:UNVERIFIED_CONTAM: Sodium/calcium exchanger NCL2 [Sesamum radiatum]|uniref:Sodium/calcium exchanger NCL2 n=1 Tax=Sesamum radiatum TaxID=300843 RepID=A0AAW2LQ21_SESRA
MANMRRLAIFPLLLLLVSHVAHSRLIRKNLELVSDGVDSERTPSFLEWRSWASTVTCEPIYGFLPCSTNVWGLLFLILVYEILLSLGGQYVANGSNLFFQIIGPGVFGASLFQFLGTIPQIVLILVSALSGSTAAAQQRANLGMGLVAGTTVMLLTLIWGSVVVLGSYDLSEANTNDSSGNQKKTTLRGYGVVTDVETSYTARIILITLFPFLILQLATIFHSSSGKRVVILVALIITVVLLAAFIFYQIFQPWIQNRSFEYLMSKYAKDKLMRLISRNGKPETRKIQELFNKINKNNDASISTAELRVLLLGVHMDDDDSSTDRNVENIMASLDTSADGRINQDEFIKGMTKLVSDISNQTPVSNSQNTNQATQGLLTSSTQTSQTSNSWLNYLRATYFLTVGTVMLCAFAEPLIRTVVDFAQAANLSSFSVSYMAIPFAMNYGVAVQSISSARQKTQKSISLTLSAIYGGVYMNNVIGLLVFLAPVYARNLASDVSAEVLVVLIICIVMSIFTSFCTTFPRWTGYLVLLLYSISLASVYILTSVFGWS